MFFLAGGRLPSFLQGGAVQAVFLEKFPQGHFGDAKSPGTPDEVQQLVARGRRMGEEKLGDGAGMPRQELPVRTAAEVMLNLLDNLHRGKFPMPKRRAGADADQASDLGYLQSHATVQQEVNGDPRTGIVPLASLEELKRCVEDGPLLISQPFRRNLRPTQPLLELLTFRGHGTASLAVAFLAVEA